VRSLEFLKLQISPWRPPFFLCSPSAAQQRRRWPSCRTARGPRLLLLASTRRPRARPLPHLFSAGFPRACHATRPSRPSTAAGRRRSPSLPLCRHHLLVWHLPRAAPRPVAALASLLWPSPARSTSPRLCTSSARPPPCRHRG
jgi:hypothetical protein